MGRGIRRRIGLSRPLLRGRTGPARSRHALAAGQVRCRLRRHHLAGGVRRAPACRRPTSRPSARRRRFRHPAGHETFSVTIAADRANDQHHRTDDQRSSGSSGDSSGPRSCAASCSPSRAPARTWPSLATQAVRDGDEWIINGQKVWSSGAQFSGWGELIARTRSRRAKARRPDRLPRSAGLTWRGGPTDPAALGWIVVQRGVPDRCPPPRQPAPRAGGQGMDGGPDHARLRAGRRRGALHRRDLRSGRSGWPAGWSSRRSDRAAAIGRSVHQRPDHQADRSSAPPLRPHGARHLDRRDPSGSCAGRRIWLGPRRWSPISSAPRLTADSGEWGTYAWTAHVLGSLGYRIAGGSDEIQRNIIGERVLGLPPEPRLDRNLPWRQTLR